MKKLLLAVGALAVLSGCATPEQNVLAGVAIGAIIANEANKPQVVYTTPPPRVRCHNRYVGRDAYGRTIYNQVCQTY